MVSLKGIEIAALTERSCVQHVMQALEAGQGGWLHTVNVDILRRLDQDPNYRTLCRDVDLSVADGMPLIWASQIQGEALPARVAGSDLLFSLSQAAAQQGRSIYLLGGSPGTAEQTQARLQALYPGLQVRGVAVPDYGFEERPGELESLVERVLEASPDLVFVALSVPKAERLIAQLKQKLPATWLVGVGISFSFAAGTVPRSPLWMQRLGVEWLHRLGAEPQRLARRYLLDDIPFALKLLAGSAFARFKR
jgi:N-acetylglucosaminyldiphosphoundecaprenol N-acetyl-beta-D-mannosaminyltransferase